MNDGIKAKIEIIARLAVGGVKYTEIARLTGLSYDGLMRIVALDAFKQARTAIEDKQIADLDAALTKRTDVLNKRFAEGVPAAVETLLEAVKQRKDMRMAIEAAKEFLDRDTERRFTKQPRGADANAVPALPAGVLAAVAAESDKVAAEVNRHNAGAAPKVISKVDKNVN